MRTTRLALLPAVAAFVLFASGCGGRGGYGAPAPAAPARTLQVNVRCPAALVSSWQALAKRVGAPVYCPSWLPQPLVGRIGSEYAPSPYVNGDRSYLVSFIWLEPISSAPYEVHVNLRGYPGQTKIPTCQDTITAGGKTVRPNIPCFADPRGHVRFGNTTATVYTANQGADTWHVLYAWRHQGSLYTISEHVAPPFTYARVVQNLDRMMRGLALVQP